MINPRRLHGAVYILENAEAQRVKVGMTSMDTTNVFDRLKDVNDMWQKRKVTCQICGARRLVKGYRIPPHVYAGPECVLIDSRPWNRLCPGGNEFPLEKNVALAESLLDNIRKRLSDFSYVDKVSAARFANNLEKRIEKFRNYSPRVGDFQVRVAYYTKHAELVEKSSHQILAKYLDEKAPFGEVFRCSVSEAREAVETVMGRMRLLESAIIDTY